MDTDVKRVLFIPQNYFVEPRPHQEWFEEFNKVFDCTYFNEMMLNKNNLGKVDFIFVQSGAIPLSLLRTLRINTEAQVIQWTGDCRSDCMSGVTDYRGHLDLTLLAVGIGQREMYEKVLLSPVDYLQQGVFKEFFIPAQELQTGNIVFIGNNYDQFEGAIERTELCKTLSSCFDSFEVIGNGFNLAGFNNKRSVPYIDSAKIYNESYISISHACFNEIEGYYSNRTLDILASGSCCLMRYVPNVEKFFTDMEHVVFYKTNDEAVEKIKFLLDNPEVRNKIANNGCILAKEKHTFAYRVKEITEYLQKLKK